MSITSGSTSINFSGLSYTPISVYYPKIRLSSCGDVESGIDLDLSMKETFFLGFKDTKLFEETFDGRITKKRCTSKLTVLSHKWTNECKKVNKSTMLLYPPVANIEFNHKHLTKLGLMEEEFEENHHRK